MTGRATTDRAPIAAPGDDASSTHLAERARLFEVADKERRRLAGNLPVLLGSEICPDCQAPTTDVQWSQGVLFRHGGYGAPQRTTLRHCAAFCGWGYTPEVIEINPRSVA